MKQESFSETILYILNSNLLLTQQTLMSAAQRGHVESELSVGTSQVHLTAAACWDTESMVEWSPSILPLTELSAQVNTTQQNSRFTFRAAALKLNHAWSSNST